MRQVNYKEIIEWNSRRGNRNLNFHHLAQQIDALFTESETIAEAAPELRTLVPIRLVTFIEVFLREVIARLVNENEEAFEGAREIVKNNKIDLAFTAHLKRKELTVGDFVAQAASLSTVDAIFGTMTRLISKFPERLKNTHPRWSDDVNQWPLPPIISDYEEMMRTLSRLFEVRNEITHELAPQSPFNPEELPGFCKATKEFIEALDWLDIEIRMGALPGTIQEVIWTWTKHIRSVEEELKENVKKATFELRKAGLEDLTIRLKNSDSHREPRILIGRGKSGKSLFSSAMTDLKEARRIRRRIRELNAIVEEWPEL